MLIHEMIERGLHKHENWNKKYLMAWQPSFGEAVTQIFCYARVVKSYFS